MKILNRDETNKLVLRPGNTKCNVASEIMRYCETLDVGEAVFIENEEWPYKCHPSTLLGRRFNQLGGTKEFSSHGLKLHGGYAVVRRK